MENELLRAIQLHQSGQLEQAGRLYQNILAKRPNDADALHLLGVVLHQVGRHEQAAQLIERALAIQPNAASYYSNLAEVYRTLGQIDRGIECCRMALRLQPEYPEAVNNLGLGLLAKGDNMGAMVQFKIAVQLKPDFAMAHNNLGNVTRIQGDFDSAIRHFREALKHDPQSAEAHSNLGQLLLERKQLDEALKHCQEAVRLRPQFPEGLSNLGNVLREIGRLEEAKNYYAEALRINPRLAMVHNNIAQALQEEGKLDDAIVWYQRALTLDANTARIHANFASALQEKELTDEAIARYETALKIDPQSVEAHNGLGFIYHEKGDYPGARRYFEDALKIRDDFAPALCNLGSLLEELNDMEGALSCFRKAIHYDPTHAGAHAQLATIQRGKIPDSDLAAVKRLLTEPDLTEGKRAVLQFGLAHVLDAKGEHAEAAELLRQANQVSVNLAEKRAMGYDPVAHVQFISDMIRVCSPEFFARLPASEAQNANLSQRPIFIVGLPRSGTTLIEQILASHSRVHGAGELRFARDDFEALPGLMNRTDAPMNCLEQLDRPTVEKLAQQHLDHLAKLNDSAERVVDKMPDNYMYLGLLSVIFPRAKFIHCRRDLRDVAVSCWMTNFRHIRWANNQEHLAERFREYCRLSEHWKQVLPVPVLDVHYEETVSDFEGVVRRILEWCELEWEQACLNFHETERPVRTASVTQVRQPIYTRSKGRWKNYEPALAELFAKLVPNAE